MLFQPRYLPTEPLTTLESTTPVNSPLIICPIFFPLTCSSDNFAHRGSNSWGITEVTPTARQAMQANVKFGDRYIPKSDMMDNNIIVKIRFLRSVKSAMGRMKNKPSAYPVCVSVASKLACEPVLLKYSAALFKSGCM